MNSDQLMTLCAKSADLSRIKAMIAYMEAGNPIQVQCADQGAVPLPPGKCDDVRDAFLAFIKAEARKIRYELRDMGVDTGRGESLPPANGNDQGSDDFDEKLREIIRDATHRKPV